MIDVGRVLHTCRCILVSHFVPSFSWTSLSSCSKVTFSLDSLHLPSRKLHTCPSVSSLYNSMPMIKPTVIFESRKSMSTQYLRSIDFISSVVVAWFITCCARARTVLLYWSYRCKNVRISSVSVLIRRGWSKEIASSAAYPSGDGGVLLIIARR